MENLKRNPLFHSISSQSTNKFRSIMNSPNYGNQQILLQSCCFFESDKSQTPHASRVILKEFKPRKKNKSGSPKLSLSNRNLNTFKKYNFSENNIEENTDLIINDKQLIITKLNRSIYLTGVGYLSNIDSFIIVLFCTSRIIFKYPITS